MTLNANIVEQLVEWCLQNDTLADIRPAARRDFFGYDEPGEARYMKGAGDVASRERRFLGWFALTFKLSDGRSPAELAASAILSGSELNSAIDSIKGCRYVLAMVARVDPGRSLVLRLENEEFTINNRQLSRILKRDEALYAHIIPAGRRGWLVGPGWVQLPIRIMPGMQAMLKELQPSPIDVERLLQLRNDPSRDHRKMEPPRDDTLKAAVDRMTKAAQAEDRANLIMTPAQWEKLVFSHMKSSQINNFIKEIVNRASEVDSVDEINKWLELAMNIWNNTPQPDRDGKSPSEISRKRNIQSGG